MSEATEKAIDIAADVVGEVAQQAEVTEKAIRSLSRVKVAYATLGAAAGVAIGGLAAFRVAYVRAETKYSQIADEEIAEMRRHYQEKALAREAEISKVDLEEIVTERGYAVTDEAPPMAVAPPEKVVEAAKEDEPTKEKPKVVEQVIVNNVFEQHRVEDEWDYHEERRRRSPDYPYVIHYDERNEFEGYSDVTLTYYEADDVLCNERDEIIGPENRDEMVGEKNLEKFGHGSHDPLIVYIRNDPMELEIEVVKSPNSYAEEVHGLAHDTNYRRNLERMRARERDQLDDA